MNATLVDLKKEILLETEYPILERDTVYTYVITVLYLFGIVVVTIKDIMMALDLFTSILTFYLLASEFRRRVFLENLLVGNVMKNVAISRWLKRYRKIYRISRIFNDFYGNILMVYVIDLLLYCSLIAMDMVSYGFSVVVNATVLGLFVSSYFLAAFAATEVNNNLYEYF